MGARVLDPMERLRLAIRVATLVENGCTATQAAHITGISRRHADKLLEVVDWILGRDQVVDAPTSAGVSAGAIGSVADGATTLHH